MVLRFIILGLLIDESMSGYDLKTFFNKSVNFFWSADLSQIYRELSKLKKDNYISYVIEEQEGRPDKKIYSITEEGKQKFEDWLKDFPSTLTPISRNEFLVRIFFSNKLSYEELHFQLKRYIKEKEDKLKTYRQIEKNMDDQPKENPDRKKMFAQKLTLRRGIYFALSEIAWASECIEEIKKLEVYSKN